MTLSMFDSTDPDALPVGGNAYAGYVDGSWPSFCGVAERFAGTSAFSLPISTGDDPDNAICLDVETGDAKPSDVPGFIAGTAARLDKLGLPHVFPVVYCDRDTAPSVLALKDPDGVLLGSVLGRKVFRLWTAHWTDSAHICSPLACGADFTADGTQWKRAAGASAYDQSLLCGDFFAPVAPARVPAPAPVEVTVKHGGTVAYQGTFAG